MTLALLLGGMGAFNGIHISTILQISTPSEMRGRVFGLLSMLSNSLAPLGMGLGGLVFDLTGQNIPLIFISCGGVMAFLSLLISLSREFRAFLAYEQGQEASHSETALLRSRSPRKSEGNENGDCES